MKVMHIVPDLLIGGVQTMVENLVYGLMEKGHEVRVVSMYEKKSAITYRMESNGCDIAYLNKKDGFDFTMIPKITTEIKKFKPDVVHTHTYILKYAILPEIFNRTNNIHTVHNVAEKEVKKAQQLLHKVLFKTKIVKPVALTKHIQKSVSKVYGLNTSEIPIANNAINLDRCMVKRLYKSDVFEIIHIGRFDVQKNHEMLINAFKIFHEKHENSRLRLVGTGPLFENVKEKVIRLGLQHCVIFEGETANVFELLQKADTLALPSLYEGMPMVIIEAMGCALPVVAANVGGIADIIDNGINGILLDGHDEKMLAKIFEKLCDNIELRIKLGTQAYRDSREYNYKIMTDRYIQIYNSK